ncbi:hypothetical protein Tco_0427903 [Tanacetum coccineum]
MDDPNITMEEYIRLEEEKARKRAIAFNDKVSSEKTLSCEPTISSPNDEIEFRISFDDSDDEDYTIVFVKNSFSYKIISTNDLKTDSENDNEKVMPSLPSPEPVSSCFDDLDFFNDFENEFPDIVYNDAQTSKSDLLNEPILSPQHIDEFDLNNEHHCSNMMKSNKTMLFYLIMNLYVPFGIPFDPKRYYKDGIYTGMIVEAKRHQYLSYEGLQYTNVDIANFKTRLARIYKRDVHKVQVFDFRGLLDLMADGLSAKMLMKHRMLREFGEAILDLDTPEAL